MPPHICYMSSTREESAQVLSRLKCKARTAAVGRGEGSKTQEMIADSLKPRNHTPVEWQTIAEHSSNLKYVRIHTWAYTIWYYRQATQHRSCRGNKREAQQATTAIPKGGTHESVRFYRGATAATDRHRQPAALLFVVVRRRSRCSSSSI